jgi:hypothetical protein
MEEINLPQSGEKFIIETGSTEEIAWLHKSFQNLGMYADAYKTAAITVLDAALIEPNLRDYNIYPATFLIRHYLELRLKEFIQSINFLNNVGTEFPKHHRLNDLWDTFINDYNVLKESENDETFVVIYDLINEISHIDPNSQVSRFSEDKNGNSLQKFQFVNLKNLKNSFIKISDTFDGISMQLESFVELKREQ